MPNFASGQVPDAKWQSGEPATGFFSPFKAFHNARPIIAYCCESCGHLDLFAPPIPYSES